MSHLQFLIVYFSVTSATNGTPHPSERLSVSLPNFERLDRRSNITCFEFFLGLILRKLVIYYARLHQKLILRMVEGTLTESVKRLE